MGIPDVLAIQFPGRDQHGEFLDLLWQGGFIPQVMVQGGCRLVRFRHMDHDRARAIARHRPKFSDHRIKGGTLTFRHTVSACKR